MSKYIKASLSEKLNAPQHSHWITLKKVALVMFLAASAILLSGSLTLKTEATLKSLQPHNEDPVTWLQTIRKQLESTSVHYPERARRQAIEGTCTIRFTITALGSVKDAKVLKQCDHAYFEKPSLEAVKNSHFPPRVVNGTATEVIGVTNQFTFTLASNSH